MPSTGSATELNDALRRAVRGEVHFDLLTRQIYSTDASSYRVVPAGVVTPRDVDDAAAVMEVIAGYNASTVPRGGGSSLSGQTVGPGVVVDFSRHLNQVLEINPEEGWARVEAGLVLDQLNAAAAAHGLMIGPDPASSRVATLGGMSANNSTGVHSIRYGLMIDHIQAVDVVLSDGSLAHFGPKTPAEIEALARQETLEGRLYREIPRLLAEYRDDIHQRYPRTWRNVAGYNLNRLLAAQEAGQPFNLAPLIVGSEGTLAHIVRLQVRLVPKPAHVRLVVLHFYDLRSALERVPFLLEHNPSAVELLSGHMIRLARSHAGYRQQVNRFVEGDPHSLLIVEFSGDHPAALAAARDKLVDALASDGYRNPIIDCTTPETVNNLWSVRKDTLGLIMSMPGDAKPLSFVDDAAVPIEELADYALEVDQVCREAGLEVAFDAHASAGCLHITPIISLKTEEGLRQMKTVSQAVMKIAIAHHGTTTGEHGEGLARSYYNEQLYGPRLHRAFRQVKSLFDPHNRMNPGKIIDAPEPWDPAILRFHPGYQTPLQPETTWFDYSPHRDMAGLVEMCNGQGLCRNLGAGVMCPSYRATRDERHATRGRANALRAALTGDLGPDGLGNHSLYEVLDLCLECKACKRECSTGVDMARLKYEFLAQYQARHGVPLRSRLFAHIATLNRLGRLAPGLTNRLYQAGWVRGLLDRWLGIDRRRKLPTLAPETFQQWFHRHSRPANTPRGPVILWDDTYITYNSPEIGQAAVQVLEAAGFEVRLVAQRKCCGRPMISKGLLAEARANAAHNVTLLEPFATQGIPIVGLEPSCIAAFRDEYPDLLRSDAARQVAQNSFFIEEFLANLADQGALDLPLVPVAPPRRVLVHGHCYQKALTGTSPLLKMLRLLPNTEVEEIPSGCCGMAGAFGYEKEHYDLSLAIGEDRLFPAIRAAGEGVIIAAAGVSCRSQIADGTGRQAVHPIQVLAAALDLAGVNDERGMSK